MSAADLPRRWRPLLATTRVIDRLNGVVGTVAAWACLPMIAFACAASVTSITDRRWGTDWSTNAFLEGQWYLFAAVFLLGAPATLARGAHVRVDALYGRYSERTQHWIDLVGGILFLLPFCVFSVYEAWDYVARSWEIREASPDPGGLPRYPLKTLIPVAFGLLFLQGAAQVIKHAGALAGLPREALGLPGSKADHGGEELAGR